MLIRLYALNSTISYALDTLAQHRTLIEQLQDKVEALRSQNEDIQRRLEQSERARDQQSSANSIRIASGPIPNLNDPLDKDQNN
jgi:hypothetical protein